MRVMGLVVLLLSFVTSSARAQDADPSVPEATMYESASAPAEQIELDDAAPEPTASPQSTSTSLEESMLGEVFGTVLAGEGEPVSGALVTVDIQGVRLRSVSTDEEGRFRFVLPAGTHQIVATFSVDDEERRAESREVIQPGETRQVELQFQAAAEPGVSYATAGLASGGVHRARATAGNNIIAEVGTLEVGGRLDAFASDQDFGGETLGITDAVILALSNRYSFGFLELHLEAGLLVKQANFLDENVFQNASLTAQVPLLEWLVPYLRGSVGTMTGAGIGYGGAAGLFARATVGRFITFEGSLGGEFLYFNASGTEDLWLVETDITAQAMIHGDREQAGIGLGTRYSIPVAHNGTVFDPGISLSFYVLTVFSIEDDWDIYLEAALVDRGETASPETQLPVLSGGFDQTRISFGVNYHLDTEEDGS